MSEAETPETPVKPEARRASTPAERQDQIGEYVLAKGNASAQELSAKYAVSLMTIHRDLDELARQGVVRKFRGGVTAQPSGVFESNVAFRAKSMAREKEQLARHALRYVESGMSIMLDDATTVERIVPHLSALAPLRVVTNYLPALRPLSQAREISLTALGGDYDPLHDSFQGVMCVEAIESLSVDALFVSTSAISGGYGYHQEDRIVAVKRAMIERAEKRYLLLDHTKLGKRALHRLAPLSVFDLVIVDGGASAEELTELERDDVTYELAQA